MFWSLEITTQPLLPTCVSHSTSGVFCAKRSSWASTCAPTARKASGTMKRPSCRSTKKVRDASRAASRCARFAAERILDRFRRDAIIVRKRVYAIAGVEALGQDGGSHAKAIQHRPAERNAQVDHY